MEDFGLVLTDLLHCSLFLLFGTISMQCASEWPKNLTKLSWCFMQLHRDTFESMLDRMLGMPFTNWLLGPIFVDHLGGVAQEGASGRCEFHSSLLILSDAFSSWPGLVVDLGKCSGKKVFPKSSPQTFHRSKQFQVPSSEDVTFMGFFT